MVFESERMVLSTVREIRQGAVNDVLVCRDTASPAQPLYTVLVVKEPETAKALLAAFTYSDKASDPDERGCIDIFAQNELLCFVFPYRAERRLSAFAAGQMKTPHIQEAVAINLVMECLSTPFPYPFLYLILCQDNIHLLADNSVYFTPFVDLSVLDTDKNEADCAVACANILLDCLEGDGRKSLKSYELLRKKLSRSAFSSLPELYRDIRLTMLPERKPSIGQRIRGWWRRNKDRLFRVLLVLMIVIIVITLIIIISQLIFGDVPWLRIFERRFDYIGTEDLRG